LVRFRARVVRVRTERVTRRVRYILLFWWIGEWTSFWWSGSKSDSILGSRSFASDMSSKWSGWNSCIHILLTPFMTQHVKQLTG
jgi:hypothetical protein